MEADLPRGGKMTICRSWGVLGLVRSGWLCVMGMEQECGIRLENARRRWEAMA